MDRGDHGLRSYGLHREETEQGNGKAHSGEVDVVEHGLDGDGAEDDGDEDAGKTMKPRTN